MLTPEVVREELKRVVDPEVMMDIVNMGLVYDISVEDNNDIDVTMTLTTPFCPAGDQNDDNLKRVAGSMDDAGEVAVNIVWEPPWSPLMFSPELKAELAEMGVDFDESMIPDHNPPTEAPPVTQPAPASKKRSGIMGWLFGR